MSPGITKTKEKKVIRFYLITFHLLISVFAFMTLMIGGEVFLNFAVIATGWSSVAIVAIVLTWGLKESRAHDREEEFFSMGNRIEKDALMRVQAIRRMRMRHMFMRVQAIRRTRINRTSSFSHN